MQDPILKDIYETLSPYKKQKMTVHTSKKEKPLTKPLTASKKKRIYRQVTPEVIAKFKAAKITEGNGTKAVQLIEPDYPNPSDRAHIISNKIKTSEVADEIDYNLALMGTMATDRLKELIDSDNEQIATKNVHYVIDHIRGKAINRSITATKTINIEQVVD